MLEAHGSSEANGPHGVDGRSGANGLLSALPDLERARVLSRCELVRLEFGQVLSEPGEYLRHVYFPIEGFISQFAMPDDSNALEVGLVGSEGMYGVELALGVNERPLRCVVHGAGHAWCMPAGEFRAALDAWPALRGVIDRYLCVLLAQLAQAAACTRFHLVEERLARWLLMTSDRTGGEHLHLTHALLASMLGVRRSGVRTAAAGLQARGLIDYSRGDIQGLDRNGLEGVSCECYRSGQRTYARVLGPRAVLAAAGTRRTS